MAAPPIYIYANFAPEWEASTGVPQAIVRQLSERFRDGVAERLSTQPCPTLVSDAADVPAGAILLFACALGNETATLWERVKPLACSAAPALWNWISPKHPYMRALAEAGVPILPTWAILGETLQAENLISRAPSVPATREALMAAHAGAATLVVKQCCALGGTLAVEVHAAAAAIERAMQLATGGRDVLVQPDWSAAFATGETKCCVAVGAAAGAASRVLGARHAPPGREFGVFTPASGLPEELCAVAGRAADVLRDHALGIGVAPPPVVRVDCIEAEGAWSVNELELCDYASWMWDRACGGAAGAFDAAVCDTHAAFAVSACTAAPAPSLNCHLDPVKVARWHSSGDALLEKLDTMIADARARQNGGGGGE